MQWVDMIGNSHWIMQHLPDLLPTSYTDANRDDRRHCLCFCIMWIGSLFDLMQWLMRSLIRYTEFQESNQMLTILQVICGSKINCVEIKMFVFAIRSCKLQVYDHCDLQHWLRDLNLTNKITWIKAWDMILWRIQL